MSALDIEDLAARFCQRGAIGKVSAPELTTSEIITCRESLLGWYHANRRKLPWRGDASTLSEFVTPPMSAYGTWVSEIMLQQTRVETVVPYWHRWMAKFPTVAALSAASPDEVNKMWAGLGYYRRAQQLLEGAKKVTADFGGVVPGTVAELLTVPGIGPYTAGAIASIAFNKPVPLVDGNVIRVMSRLRALTSEVGSKDMDKACWALGAAAVDPVDPGAFNQALMELGATVCKPTSPLCDACPVRKICHAHQLASLSASPPSSSASSSSSSSSSSFSSSSSASVPSIDDDAGHADDADDALLNGLPASVTYFPLRAPKKRPREVCVSVGVFRRQAAAGSVVDLTGEGEGEGEDCRYLFIKRPEGGLLQNQWEFPSVVLWEEGGGKGKGKGKGKGQGKERGKEEGEEEGDTPFTASEVDTSHTALWAPFPSFLQRNLLEPPPALSKAVSVLSPPLVHVFSHERHTMHVHLQDWPQLASSVTTTSTATASCNGSESRRETRWMTAAEIRAAGITSGCKKVLELVLSNGQDEGAAGRKKRTATANKKDKASAKKAKPGDSPKQPNISSFFAKAD